MHFSAETLFTATRTRDGHSVGNRNMSNVDILSSRSSHTGQHGRANTSLIEAHREVSRER